MQTRILNILYLYVSISVIYSVLCPVANRFLYCVLYLSMWKRFAKRNTKENRAINTVEKGRVFYSKLNLARLRNISLLFIGLFCIYDRNIFFFSVTVFVYRE